MLPKIGITLGDPAGIGPEILAKLLTLETLEQLCTPIVIGDARVVRQGLDLIGSPLEIVTHERLDADRALGAGVAHVIDLHNIAPAQYDYGQIGAATGRAAGEFIERAIQLALAGTLDAVVTNPINKESFILGGWGERYPGHTEMFTHLTGADRTCMMLASGPLRVCHVTTHVSLLDALTRHITVERITDVIGLAHRAGISLGLDKLGPGRPSVGVAAINPHAGEDGMFGDEEARIVTPAIEAARAQGIAVDGPVPADTLFSKAVGGMYDFVVAMYHDQGHIPVKLAGFHYSHETGEWDMHGVNVTLGLPIIRTSVDHGTAFDRAGKNIADHRSLLEAVNYAVALATGRPPTAT